MAFLPDSSHCGNHCRIAATAVLQLAASRTASPSKGTRMPGRINGRRHMMTTELDLSQNAGSEHRRYKA
eukprot:scaffold95581_cov33-Tisochrysis_lutea.AAC.2